jgi:hypothetical protein
VHYDRRSTPATKNYVFPTTTLRFGELESNRLQSPSVSVVVHFSSARIWLPSTTYLGIAVHPLSPYGQPARGEAGYVWDSDHLTQGERTLFWIAMFGGS